MAGKFDLIVSGMTITDERKKAVLFSDPYYDAGLLVLISKTKAPSLKTAADLNKPDVRLAVKQGTTGDIYAQKSLPKATLVRLESESDAANSVRLGKADAFVYDKPFLALYQSVNGDKTQLLDGLLSKEQFGVAARPSDGTLVAAFNSWLAQWRKQGSYDAAITKHFVTMPWKGSIQKLW
jgi:polar amino acid transport system substrate-binding protein